MRRRTLGRPAVRLGIERERSSPRHAPRLIGVWRTVGCRVIVTGGLLALGFGSGDLRALARSAETDDSAAPDQAETVDAPTPVGLPGTWTMMFDDEFSGTTLDPAKWSTCFWWANGANGCTNAGPQELGWYQSDDVLVGDGMLKLKAERRTIRSSQGMTYQYTSGMASTGGIEHASDPQFMYTYGFAEIRAQVPRGKGLWPEFWMLPVGGLPNASPSSRPEMDAFEILGDSTNVLHMNYHFVNLSGGNGDSGTDWTGPDFSTDWHVFGLDWEPDAIVWYSDGVERYRYTDSATIASKPAYLLLNLAVGGAWPGAPDASSPFPTELDVDYVRVWQAS